MNVYSDNKHGMTVVISQGKKLEIEKISNDSLD